MQFMVIFDSFKLIERTQFSYYKLQIFIIQQNVGRVTVLVILTLSSRGRTYVMITYVSKENYLGPDDKIRYIWGLKGPIFIL